MTGMLQVGSMTILEQIRTELSSYSLDRVNQVLYQKSLGDCVVDHDICELFVKLANDMWWSRPRVCAATALSSRGIFVSFR